jgi:hypothetical protein
MEFEVIRPVLSGIVGGIIATWLIRYWSRRLPSSWRSQPREALLRRHRAAVRAGNALFFIGLVAGVSLYWIGGFASTDYRPMLWAFGLASVLPLAAIGLLSVVSRRSASEAYVAFSLGQGTPIWATYGLLGAGVVAFFFAVASLGT